MKHIMKHIVSGDIGS